MSGKQELQNAAIPEPAHEAAVEISGLTKTYRNTAALQGLTMHVPRGSIYGFVGPNGAGKTTTMRILATLLEPTSGSATIEGISVVQSPGAVRERTGYMPDFFGVYDDLTAAEYLSFYAASHGVPSRKRAQVVNDLLDLIELAHKRDEYVESLSRGMKQRLGLARCLVHNPGVLLLDEPASGLDPRARVEMRELLKELRSMGKTILISSHILPELADLCTHIGIIDRGVLIAEGTVARIMAELGANRIEVRVVREVETAIRILSLEPLTSNIRLHDQNTVYAGFDGDDRAMHSLLLRLIEAGVAVSGFTRASGGLEEIFMQITGAETSESSS